MTLLANVDLVVYGMVGFLATLLVFQQRRLRRVKETEDANCGWGQVIMAWLVALLIGAAIAGAKYTFSYLGQQSAHEIISKAEPPATEIKVNVE